MKATSLFLIGLMLIILAAAVQVEDIAGPYSIRSTSPTNSFLTGSKALYEELLARGYDVILGGVGDARYYKSALYLIIGPEKPFTQLEIALIKGLVEGGGFNVIIADETGVSNSLVEELVGVRISGSYIRSGSTMLNGYLVPVECIDRGIISSKVSYIYPVNQPSNYQIVCEATDSRYPIGIVAGDKGRVMVIADSSIFANFLVNGYNGLPSTRDVALRLIESMIPERHAVIIFDVHHYKESFRINVGAIVSALLYSISHLMDSLGDEVEGGGLLSVGVGLLLIPLLSSYIILKPSTTPADERRKPEDAIWEYVEEEARAILGGQYRERLVVDRVSGGRARLYKALYRLTGGRDA